MKISILNGSPKGSSSVTIQYVKFLEKRFSDVKFKYYNVAEEIIHLKNNIGKIEDLCKEISDSNLIIWAFPVYYTLVPAQLKLFIEIIFDNQFYFYFNNKYSTAITTSINFMDHNAHNYIEGISNDMGMSFIKGISAEMMDLTNSNFRNNFIKSFELTLNMTKNKHTIFIDTNIFKHKTLDFIPTIYYEIPKTYNFNVVVIKEKNGISPNLDIMVDVFRKFLPNDSNIIELNDEIIHNGCLGCIKCSYDNKCVYENKDKFFNLFKNKIEKADAIIFAGKVVDRYFSYRFKAFFDQSFFNGHKPYLKDKQIVTIVSGALSQCHELKDSLNMIYEISGGNNLGFISDESTDSEYLTLTIRDLTEKLILALLNKYHQQRTFLGVAGAKIFRDFVYRNRSIFVSDFEYYKRNKLFDFPNKFSLDNFSNSIIKFLMSFYGFRKNVYMNIKEYMLKPYKKIN